MMMASACVNNVGIPPENFLDYGWLTPRISFTARDREKKKNNNVHSDEQKSVSPKSNAALPAFNRLDPPEVSDLQVSDNDLYDFEFRLHEDPVIMLPADQLFSDGKLVPLMFPVSRPVVEPSSVPSAVTVRSSAAKEAVEVDPFLFSPKAPRCSSRWKELLGLKKLSLNPNNSNSNSKPEINNPSAGIINNGSKSRRLFLHRTFKSSCNSSSSSSNESSLNIPLLKDLDSHSVIKSSRRSLSLCSSSCQEHHDLPRLSLDSDKPVLKHSTISHYSNPNPNPPPRLRLVKQRAIPSENQVSAGRVGRSPVRRTPDSSTTLTPRGVSMDSPRMNSSGKVIFQGLERSSSSPSTFNGGPPMNNKQRGLMMERSYSANVRVTPFLNVPVGSLSKSSVFGFQLFPTTNTTTPQKRDGNGGNYSSSSSLIGGGGMNRGQQQQHQVSGTGRNRN